MKIENKQRLGSFYVWLKQWIDSEASRWIICRLHITHLGPLTTQTQEHLIFVPVWTAAVSLYQMSTWWPWPTIATLDVRHGISIRLSVLFFLHFIIIIKSSCIAFCKGQVMHDRYFLRRLPTNPEAEVEKTAIIREKERCDIVCSIVYTAHSLTQFSHGWPTKCCILWFKRGDRNTGGARIN